MLPPFPCSLLKVPVLLMESGNAYGKQVYGWLKKKDTSVASTWPPVWNLPIFRCESLIRT